MVVFSGCDFNTHKWLNEECPQVGSAMGRRHFTEELKHQVAPSEESRGKRCTSPHPTMSPIAHMPPGSPVKQPLKRRGYSPAQRFTSGVLPMEPEALPTTSRDPPKSSLAGYSVGPLPSRPAEPDHPLHTARRMAKFPICSPPPPPAPKPEGIARNNPNSSPVVPAPAKQPRRTKGPGTANLTRSSSVEQPRTGRKMVGTDRNNSLSRSHSKDDLMPVNSWCPLSSSKKHIPGRHPTQESSPSAIHPRVHGKRQSGRSNSPDSLSIGTGRSDPAGGSPGPDTPRGGRRLYGEAVQSSRLVSSALHHAPPSASRLAEARPHTGLRTEHRERSSSPFVFGSDEAGRSKGIKCAPRSYSPLW